MLPLLAAATAGYLFLRGKRRNPKARRPHRRRRVKRNPNRAAQARKHIAARRRKLFWRKYRTEQGPSQAARRRVAAQHKRLVLLAGYPVTLFALKKALKAGKIKTGRSPEAQQRFQDRMARAVMRANPLKRRRTKSKRRAHKRRKSKGWIRTTTVTRVTKMVRKNPKRKNHRK